MKQEQGNSETPIKSANSNLSNTVQALKTRGIFLFIYTYIKIMLMKFKPFYFPLTRRISASYFEINDLVLEVKKNLYLYFFPINSERKTVLGVFSCLLN